MTTTSLMRRVDAHFATLDLTNEGTLWDSQISITSLGPCSSWHSQTCFPAIGMSKSISSHEWRKYLYTPLKTNHYVPLRGDRTLRSVHPVTEQLSGDRTLSSIQSALTGRVRSRFSLSRTLLESTRCWHLASGRSPLSVRSHQMKSP